MKGSVALDDASPDGLTLYGRLCGAALAHADARAGQPALLAGYMGKSAAFDDSLAAFAVSYADQNARDYESFLDAIRSGRVPADRHVDRKQAFVGARGRCEAAGDGAPDPFWRLPMVMKSNQSIQLGRNPAGSVHCVHRDHGDCVSGGTAIGGWPFSTMPSGAVALQISTITTWIETAIGTARSTATKPPNRPPDQFPIPHRQERPRRRGAD